MFAKLAFLSATAISAAALAASPVSAQTAAYTGTNATAGGAGGMLNIGREFSVSGSGINVSAFGIFDFGDNGLLSSHTVTLFSGIGAGATPLYSVNVPGGTAGTYIDGFRFASLDGSVHLTAGNYSLIGYGLNSAGGDPYGNLGGVPTGPLVTNLGFDPFQFTSAISPAYPNGGDTNNHSSVSLLYTPAGAVPEPATWAMMMVGFGMIGFGLRRRSNVTTSVRFA